MWGASRSAMAAFGGDFELVFTVLPTAVPAVPALAQPEREILPNPVLLEEDETPPMTPGPTVTCVTKPDGWEKVLKVELGTCASKHGPFGTPEEGFSSPGQYDVWRFGCSSRPATTAVPTIASCPIFSLRNLRVFVVLVVAVIDVLVEYFPFVVI
ncbi:hypothetical protein M758_7G150300 [Ceratodon purpureus]|nr:hypothetical protein M758_7G150300 [Ceratodon purpureus]